jgi:hypothetical protein
VFHCDPRFPCLWVPFHIYSLLPRLETPVHLSKYIYSLARLWRIFPMGHQILASCRTSIRNLSPTTASIAHPHSPTTSCDIHGYRSWREERRARLRSKPRKAMPLRMPFRLQLLLPGDWQPCSEETRALFNFIQRFIRELGKDAPASSRQETTIPYDDVVRAQQLCAGLLEQHKSIAVDPIADPLHSQVTALNELARAKREHTDAVSIADEVEALRKIVGTSPRKITISYEHLGRGQKGHCLRLMTYAETKAILKGLGPIFQTIGQVAVTAKVRGLFQKNSTKF